MTTYLTVALSLADSLKNAALEPLVTAPLLLSILCLPHVLFLETLHFSRTPAFLTTLLFLGAMRRLNNFLSDGILNNWESDAYDWTKEIVVITGGSSGIGKLVVQDLCRRGISVAIIDIVEPKYEIPQMAQFFQCDLSKSDDITKACSKIRDTMGHPSILLNNAGIASGRTILDTHPTEYHAMFDIGTIAHFHLVKEFMPMMIEKNHGHIITVSSMASFVTIACNVSYSQMKSSAHAFHEGLGQEIRHVYGSKKIRTSILHPTWIDTPMIKRFSGSPKWTELTLKASDVSNEIVLCILNGRSKHVVLPKTYAWVGTVKGWPSWIQEGLRNMGAASMDVIRR